MGVPSIGVRGDALKVYYSVTLTQEYYVTSLGNKLRRYG